MRQRSVCDAQSCSRKLNVWRILTGMVDTDAAFFEFRRRCGLRQVAVIAAAPARYDRFAHVPLFETDASAGQGPSAIKGVCVSGHKAAPGCRLICSGDGAGYHFLQSGQYSPGIRVRCPVSGFATGNVSDIGATTGPNVAVSTYTMRPSWSVDVSPAPQPVKIWAIRTAVSKQDCRTEFSLMNRTIE
jgi:hypothetical protein